MNSGNTLSTVVYELSGKRVPFRFDEEAKTIWGTQAQIAALFGINRRTATEHLRNLFSEGEIVECSVCRKFQQTASDGKTYETLHYDLNAICAVGYRVKSPEAIQFRQWASDLIHGVVVGRDYGTAIADQELRRFMMQVAESNEQTHRILATNHTSLVARHDGLVTEVKEGFIHLSGRLVAVEDGQKFHADNIQDVRDELVALHLKTQGKRKDPTKATLKALIHVVAKHYHCLCPMCNDKEHPILVPGNMFAGFRFADASNFGPAYAVQKDHYHDVGRATRYDLWPLHCHCHLKKTNAPIGTYDPAFRLFQQRMLAECPMQLKVIYQQQKLI